MLHTYGIFGSKYKCCSIDGDKSNTYGLILSSPKMPSGAHVSLVSSPSQRFCLGFTVASETVHFVQPLNNRAISSARLSHISFSFLESSQQCYLRRLSVKLDSIITSQTNLPGTWPASTSEVSLSISERWDWFLLDSKGAQVYKSAKMVTIWTQRSRFLQRKHEKWGSSY